jgi:hypothetical protein
VTPKQIQRECAKYVQRIKVLQREIEKIRIDLNALQDECSHPRLQRWTDISGVGASNCPDCGWGD